MGELTVPRGRQSRCRGVARRAGTAGIASTAVVIVSLWVRAHFLCDQVALTTASVNLTVIACAMRGHLALCVEHLRPSPLVPRLRAYYDRLPADSYDRYWYGGSRVRAQRSPDILGLQFCKYTPPPGDLEPARETLAVPYWLPLAGCVAPFGLARARRLVRRRRRLDRERRGLCAVCGYDLRGSAGSCPECGSARGSPCDAGTPGAECRRCRPEARDTLSGRDAGRPRVEGRGQPL